MNSRAQWVGALEAASAVAVLRLDDPARLQPVVDALAAGEVRAMEVTLTMPDALDALAKLSHARDDRLLVGAGSVLDGETARLAILAGARFIVAPTYRAPVVEMCHRYGVVAVPGALTPTEILTAWEGGADLVKVFPAGSLGPDYLKDLRGPMPQLRLMATGGVTADNAGAFLAAGAVAVGLGGALVERDAVVRGDYARITEQARRVMKAIRSAREKSR
jgi:2-dehydro-3-deoxyphosphogluconate aldolase/(4S)-4-hydroxy-2-oxoglutarate aldolase